jgi:beta-glucanase (GH16 family)
MAEADSYQFPGCSRSVALAPPWAGVRRGTCSGIRHRMVRKRRIQLQPGPQGSYPLAVAPSGRNRLPPDETLRERIPPRRISNGGRPEPYLAFVLRIVDVLAPAVISPRRLVGLARPVAGVTCALALTSATALAGRAHANADPSPPMSVESPLFADEFDGVAGSPPNPAYWGYDVGRWGESAGELQYYTDRTDNARLDGNGNLELIAKPEKYSGASYTSARLQTRDKESFEPPVRIESRIQMPAGVGLLTAFWTLGTDLFTNGWPKCGEIDIVEVKGDTPHVAHFHTHSAASSGLDYSVGDEWTAPTSLADGFHDYRIDWYHTRIEFYLDDVLRLTVARADMPSETWAFSKAHYLTLNTAVGNLWTGPPDRTTPWPAVMRIDWVKAWRLESTPISPPPAPKPSPVPPAALSAPVRILAMRVTPRHLHLARAPDRRRHRPAQHATRARVTVRTSRSASLIVLIEAQRPGVRRGSDCVAPSRSRRGRTCTRFVTLRGTRHVYATNGVGRFGLTPTADGHALAPGRYRLAVTALDTSGNRVGPTSAAFVVTR